MGANDTAQKHAQILSQHVCMPGSWGDTIGDLSKCTCHLDDIADICQNMVFLLTGLLTIPFVFSSVFIQTV